MRQRNFYMINLQKIQDFFNIEFMKGTKFQIKVWKYLKKIPKGEVKPINRWLLE